MPRFNQRRKGRTYNRRKRTSTTYTPEQIKHFQENSRQYSYWAAQGYNNVAQLHKKSAFGPVNSESENKLLGIGTSGKTSDYNRPLMYQGIKR